MEFIKLANINDFTTKPYKTFSIFSKNIGIFKKEDGTFYAMESNCKHQNANLLAQRNIKLPIVTCQRHGWVYNFETGECSTESGSWAGLRHFPIKIEKNDIFVCPKAIEKDEEEEYTLYVRA